MQHGGCKPNFIMLGLVVCSSVSTLLVSEWSLKYGLEPSVRLRAWDVSDIENT